MTNNYLTRDKLISTLILLGFKAMPRGYYHKKYKLYVLLFDYDNLIRVNLRTTQLLVTDNPTAAIERVKSEMDITDWYEHNEKIDPIYGSRDDKRSIPDDT